MDVPNKVEERSHRVGVKNQAIASGLAATAKKLADTPPVREKGTHTPSKHTHQKKHPTTYACKGGTPGFRWERVSLVCDCVYSYERKGRVGGGIF